MLAISLALSASLLWGTADFLGGIMGRRYQLLAVISVSQLIGTALVVAVTLSLEGGPPDLLHLLPAVGAGLAAVTALTAFYRGLAVGVMSIVAPISALSVVIPVLYGLAVGNDLKELQLVGMALAVSGTVMAARESDTRQRRHLHKGVALALVAAVGFGLFFIGMDESSEGGHYLWATVAARSLAVPAITVVALLRGVQFGQLRPSIHWIIALGIFDVSAQIIFGLASTKGLISLVSVLSALYPVVVVFLASTFLHERIRKTQWTGVALAIAGVLLIAGSS